MSEAGVQTALTDFIERDLLYERGEPVAPDEPLVDGLLDSIDVLRVVVFVEKQFGIRIEDDELVPENFATIESLTRFVEAKQTELA